MNNVSQHGAHQHSLQEAPEATDYESEANQYLTFKVADYLLALPGQKILRVVATPPPDQGGLIRMGLVQLAQYSIQIIDLPKLLELEAASHQPWSVQTAALAPGLKEPGKETAAQNPPFLIVLQNANKDLWGIAVYEPPDLMEIPNYALKSIPPKQRQTRALRWVSHIVTYDSTRNRHSLPILDLSELLER